MKGTTTMKKYYEAYDLRYRQVHARGLEWFDREPTAAVKKTMEQYGIGKETAMLELCCGEGRDASILLESGYDLLATDVSPRAVDFCREKFPQWAERFQVLDCLTEKLEQRFDFIYAIAVLHMLVLDEDRQAMLGFIRQHLTDAGVGLIVVMGDGEMQRATDADRAFDLQERCHEQSGQVFEIASTSCCIVTREVFREELLRAGLAIAELGDTVWADVPAAMYAVVKRGD